MSNTETPAEQTVSPDDTVEPEPEEELIISGSAKEVISHQEKIIGIASGSQIIDAAKRMREKGIHALIVCDQNNRGQRIFMGIITKTDFNNAFHQRKDLGRVRDVMTHAEDVRTVDPNTKLKECYQLMLEGLFSHLPVLKTKNEDVTKIDPTGEEIIAGYVTEGGIDKKVVVAGIISDWDITLRREDSRIRAAEIASEMPPS